jgi:hypothetical protein
MTISISFIQEFTMKMGIISKVLLLTIMWGGILYGL